jgi:hypothetical protein
MVTLNHPQSDPADSYRELGEVFGVALKWHNQPGGAVFMLHSAPQRRRSPTSAVASLPDAQ